MADCEQKIGPVGSKYRIWLRRSDTHKRITDTNIWVGNVHIPKDKPYCKISSGKTKNDECWAFVEFDTWDDLLRAIGEEPDTVNIRLNGELIQGEAASVNIRLSGELVQDVGESVIIITYTGSQVGSDSGTTSAFTITSENATVTGYTVDSGASVIDSGETFVVISYPENQSQTDTRTYTVTAKGKDPNDNPVQGSASFTQSKKTAPPQYYLEFTDEEDLVACANVTCEGLSGHSVGITTNLPQSEWGVAHTADWVHATKRETDILIDVDPSDEGVRNIAVTVTGTSVGSLIVNVRQVDCSTPTPKIVIENYDDVVSTLGNVPCAGLPSPGYDIEVNCDFEWRVKLSDIDDEYWLFISSDAEKVTVCVDQNTDPHSGKGGAPRTGSFIIEATDPSLGVQPITLTVSQDHCDDLIAVDDRAFVFTCDGPDSYTRQITAWSDLEWHLVPDFGEWETTEWFSVSPASGVGDGSFTVTILRDNYDNAVRGSGYLQIYTGSTQTYLDWDINVRQEPTPFFNVSGNSIHAASEGGNVSVTVYTNQPITASTTDSWIKNLSIGENIRVVGGTAYTIVTFTIEENSSVDQRDGNVTIGSTYSGPCGNFESENVQVLQNGANTDSATFIRVKKDDEPITAYRQEIEYPIQEADASTTAVTFNIWSDGKCKLTDITSETGHDGLRVVMVNGAVELDVTDGTPFDGTGMFKAIYGQAYIGHEKNFKITFEVSDPGIITTESERATVEITQERDYPVAVTGVTFEHLAPHIAPNTTDGPGNCCGWHLTEMWIEVYAETLYKSGWRTHSSEAIDNYIKRVGSSTGVDTDMLSLKVLNNPSSGQKYCYTWEDDIALADELHGGTYHPTFDYPFKIEFSPNTGTTTTTDPWADGFRRDVQFMATYRDDDGNFVQETFIVEVPYCNPPEPEEQEVYIVSGSTFEDEVVINPGVGTTVEIRLVGLESGETKLHFESNESLTDSRVSNFMVNGDSVDVTYGDNSWTADASEAIVSFTRLDRGDFNITIECDRPGYSRKTLVVWLEEWNG